ncbi:hypothetical protein ABT158_50520 [Nonomuraea sp. NPDC001636]|uniref:hypothetical protein n=1 Tax=Nonomuraea sp. NPDC001636 TaxID=3154391 RepID=UPI0033272EFF
MTVTVPLVLVFGAMAFIAWRYLGLRLWHALITLLFGFLLAATTFAPEIRALLYGALRWFSSH